MKTKLVEVPEIVIDSELALMKALIEGHTVQWRKKEKLKLVNGAFLWDDSEGIRLYGKPLFPADWTVYKEVPVEWWENIPEGGRLCWVTDQKDNITRKGMRGVIIRKTKDLLFLTVDNITWRYATPLTNEELEAFKTPE